MIFSPHLYFRVKHTFLFLIFLRSLGPTPETAFGDVFGSSSRVSSPLGPRPPAASNITSESIFQAFRRPSCVPGLLCGPWTRGKALIRAPSCRLSPSSMLKVIHGGPGAPTHPQPLIGCLQPADMWICLGALTYLAACSVAGKQPRLTDAQP